MNVLFVGDHPEVRELVLSLLRGAGHTVVDASAVDVVVADGATLARLLVPVGVPVVGLSADPCTYAGHMRQAGVRRVVPKPFDVEELLAAVARVGKGEACAGA